MKTLSRASLGLIVPLACVFSAGCLADSSAVSIRGFEFITSEGNACLPSGTSLTQGLLDTSVGTGYMVAVAVTNELPNNGDNELRPDTNTVTLDTAEVSFRTSEGAAFAAPADERIPLSIIVPSGGDATAAIQVLTPENGALIAGATEGYLIVELRLTGKTSDGAAIASTTSSFPVRLCASCVSVCAPDEEVVASCSPGQADGNVCAAVP